MLYSLYVTLITSIVSVEAYRLLRRAKGQVLTINLSKERLDLYLMSVHLSCSYNLMFVILHTLTYYFIFNLVTSHLACFKSTNTSFVFFIVICEFNFRNNQAICVRRLCIMC